MSRDETRFSPDVGSLYSFVEVTNWTVTPTQCTFAQKGGITSNYGWSFTGYSQLEWGEGGTWHDFGTEKSGSFTGYGDKVYDSHTSYFSRQSSPRTVYLANYAHAYVNGQSSSARAYIQFTVPALPPNATTLTATRNSDTSVSLSWATSMGYADSVRVERSTDGSAYSEIAVLSNLASSYTDSTTSADHSYTYRWRYHNAGAYGGYSATASVTMQPTAPTSISVERADATDVDVTLGNVSMVATSVEWQASYDNGTTWSASTTVNGSPVTSFTASTSGGTVLIRVRNVNSVGSSDWIVSEPIVTITPPAAPTLLSPTNVFNMSAGSVTFQWLHNPKDGSAQTAAQLAYSTDGGSTWTTVTLTTAQSYTITPLPWTAGTTVTWRVRTKGADASYGDWASSKQFTCYQVPSLTFAASNPPSTVTALPIPIQVTYSDPQSVACAAASVTIQKDGRTVYTEPLTINGNTLSGSIDAAEFLPVNGESYMVSVTARSGTSLQASANMVITVDYVAPTLGELNIQNDPETGYASLVASYDNNASVVTYSGNTNTAISVSSQAIKSLTVDGKSVQNGTPTPSSPVTVQVVSSLSISVTHEGTTTVTPIDLQGNVLASLPDGTKDVLTVDSAGHVAIEKNTQTLVCDGSESWTAYATWNGNGQYCYYRNYDNKKKDVVPYCDMLTGETRIVFGTDKHVDTCTCDSSGYLCVRVSQTSAANFKTWLSNNNMTFVVGVATPATVDLGSITLPTIADGDTVEIIASVSTPVQLVGYDGSADADSITVIRVNPDGSTVTLLENGESGAGITDMYAPLNTPYRYDVVTYAASGAYAVKSFANQIDTTRWFAYWVDGDGNNRVAYAKWNASGSYSLTRPEKKRVRYAGRKWPVSYDSKAMEQVHSMTWTVVDYEDWENGYKDLMNDGGRGVYKGCDGWVFHADFEYNAEPNYTSLTRMGNLKLTITRIDGAIL